MIFDVVKRPFIISIKNTQMNNEYPFTKKLNNRPGVINKLQIEEDDVIDDKAKNILDHMTVDQLSQENESIAHEINIINQEFLEISEKSNNIEALLKTQQECMSLLNKDNDELKKIADQTTQKLMEKSAGKRKKQIKESDLLDQIRLSIEMQESITKNSISMKDKDPKMKKIESIRRANLQYSSSILSNFDSFVLKRQNIIERYNEYSDEMTNHTKQNKLNEEYEALLKENQELKEIYSKREEQKNYFEKKKKKLASLEDSIDEIESIKQKIDIIDKEIEDKKNYPEISKILLQDAQVTQTQPSYTDFYQSVECMTDSPLFHSLGEKEIKMKINEFEKEIADLQQQKEYESAEMRKKIDILIDQHQTIAQGLEMLKKHFIDKDS